MTEREVLMSLLDFLIQKESGSTNEMKLFAYHSDECLDKFEQASSLDFLQLQTRLRGRDVFHALEVWRAWYGSNPFCCEYCDFENFDELIKELYSEDDGDPDHFYVGIPEPTRHATILTLPELRALVEKD